VLLNDGTVDRAGAERAVGVDELPSSWNRSTAPGDTTGSTPYRRPGRRGARAKALAIVNGTGTTMARRVSH
jgi:hypothetical protein